MKKTFGIKLFIFTFVILLLLSTFCLCTDVPSLESEADIQDNIELDGSNEETEDSFVLSDVYEFDSDIVVDKLVDGNVFAFGENITISGEIGGDVFVFGGNVTFTDTAYVYGAIFAFAQNLTLNGVCADVYAACESFTLGTDSVIFRDLRLAADKANLNGEIKRDAYIETNELVFPDDNFAHISGNLNYTSSSEFAISEAMVGGDINYTPISSDEVSIEEKISSYITSILSTLLYSLAVILLTLWLAPNFKEKAGKLLKKKAPFSFGIGLLSSVIIIASAIVLLLFAVGLGIEISLAMIGIFILVLTIAKTIFSIACAKLISDKFQFNKPVIFVLITLLVVLIASLFELIPYIGGLVGFIICMTGFGIIVLNLISKKNLDDNIESEVKEG